MVTNRSKPLNKVFDLKRLYLGKSKKNILLTSINTYDIGKKKLGPKLFSYKLDYKIIKCK